MTLGSFARLIIRGSRVLAIGALFVTGPTGAVELGTPSPVAQGIDQVGTAVGTEGQPVLGNNHLDADVVGDLVGGGGNAITVCFPHLLAPVTATLEFTTTVCACSGTQIVAISAANGTEVCDDIENSSFNQGCSQRGACTNNGDPGALMDIVGPFSFTPSCTNCQTGDWRFLTAEVPAAPTRVTISGLSDAAAATVDFFSLNVGGTLIQTGPFSSTFATETTGASLASTISGLSGLITASYAANVLTITASNTGPISFTGLRLETTTPATTTVYSIKPLNDPAAAAANKFTLKIDGVDVNQSSVNFFAATNLPTLATVLDVIPGVDVFDASIDDDATVTLIADNSCPVTQSVNIANVGDHFTLSDVDLGFSANNNWRSDIQAILRSPAGTEVKVIDDPNGFTDDRDNYDVLLDDASGNPLDDGNNDDTAAPFYDRTATPSNPLSAFNGQDAFGTWTLKLCDDFGDFAGTYIRSRLILRGHSGLSVVASGPGPRVFTNLSLSATPPQVTNINSNMDTGDGSLVEAEGVGVALSQLLVSFDSVVLDPPDVVLLDNDVTNPANYLLFEDGANNTVDTVDCAFGLQTDDTAVPVNSVSYNSTTRTATLNLNGGIPLGPGTYRLHVCGTTSITDGVGQRLDGNGDGTGGDDFVRTFSILDFDGDGDPDYSDPDDDNDGMSDAFEDANMLDPKDPDDAGVDLDGDGLTNLEEFNIDPDLDPRDPDTDGDGIGDALDTDPINVSNGCTPGDLDQATVGGLVTTDLTCAGRLSVSVDPGTVVQDPGHLRLIGPIVTFPSDFEACQLTVISADPCPACPGPSLWPQ
jgi:hypothetical protein